MATKDDVREVANATGMMPNGIAHTVKGTMGFLKKTGLIALGPGKLIAAVVIVALLLPLVLQPLSGVLNVLAIGWVARTILRRTGRIAEPTEAEADIEDDELEARRRAAMNSR